MIISCEKCHTRYAVDPAKLGVAGRTVRCAKCHHNWFQPAPEADPMVTRVAAPQPAEPASGVARPPSRANGPLSRDGQAPAAQTAAPSAAPPPETAPAGPPAAKTDEAEAKTQASAPPGAIDEERIDALIRPRRPSSAYEDEGEEKAEPYKPSRFRRADGTEEIRNLPGFPRQRVNTTLVAGWVALVLLVPGLVGASFFTFRDAIAERLPASRKIYVAMGLELADARPDPVRALRIQTPQPPPARAVNGVLIQAIKGYVENDTDHSLPVPLLRGVLFNDNGDELYSWTFRAQASQLEPKQSATFETEVLDMPENASRVEVMFDSYYRSRNKTAQR